MKTYLITAAILLFLQSFCSAGVNSILTGRTAQSPPACGGTVIQQAPICIQCAPTVIQQAPITIQPPPITIQPPPITIQPPAITVGQQQVYSDPICGPSCGPRVVEFVRGLTLCQKLRLLAALRRHRRDVRSGFNVKDVLDCCGKLKMIAEIR